MFETRTCILRLGSLNLAITSPVTNQRLVFVSHQLRSPNSPLSGASGLGYYAIFVSGRNLPSLPCYGFIKCTRLSPESFHPLIFPTHLPICAFHPYALQYCWNPLILSSRVWNSIPQEQVALSDHTNLRCVCSRYRTVRLLFFALSHVRDKVLKSAL